MDVAGAHAALIDPSPSAARFNGLVRQTVFFIYKSAMIDLL
jgi:hypothetical protein